MKTRIERSDTWQVTRLRLASARRAGDMKHLTPALSPFGPQGSVFPQLPSSGLRPPSPAPAGEGHAPAKRGEGETYAVPHHASLVTCYAFTLIELLTVIAIMAVIAGFTLVVVGRLKRTEYISIATAEMKQIEKALDDYKAKYGTYPPSNANLPGIYPAALWPLTNSLLPQLYYELSGVTNTGTAFVTLDGSAQINVADVQKAFNVGGFINCSKGSGDDITPARNFLLGLRQHQIVEVSNNTVLVNLIVTSVRGPDLNYTPLREQDANPFRYLCPGINNPDSYDLYVQLVISGKTNLVCNWTKNVIINSPLP